MPDPDHPPRRESALIADAQPVHRAECLVDRQGILFTATARYDVDPPCWEPVIFADWPVPVRVPVLIRPADRWWGLEEARRLLSG